MASETAALTGFSPSGARGKVLDQRVRDRLADSLCRLADAFEALDEVTSDGIRNLAASARLHPVTSRVMAGYVEAVEALAGEDDERALCAVQRLIDPELRHPATQRVLALSEADLGPGMPSVYLRQVNDNQSLPADFSPVSADQFAHDRKRIEESLGMLDRALPGLAGEVRALAPEIVVVTSHGANGYEFHGASSFHLWVSILVNADAHPTRLKLAEVIAHESGHALLHGATLGRPLVSNDPDQLYSSPLRDDPRPMEGIVHATYVLARMHFTMGALLASSELDCDEQKAAAEYMADFSDWYAEGLGIVQAHASFTDVGARLFDGAVRYMAGHSS